MVYIDISTTGSTGFINQLPTGVHHLVPYNFRRQDKSAVSKPWLVFICFFNFGGYTTLDNKCISVLVFSHVDFVTAHMRYIQIILTYTLITFTEFHFE